MNLAGFLKSKLFRDFAVVFLILGIVTVFFRCTRADIALQQYFFSPGRGWILQYHPFWDLLYRYGIFPGYLVAFASLVIIWLSYWNSRFISLRKAALVMVFTLVVGPGILINLALKDHSGRPRPRDITEFGGTEKFICVCEKGLTDEGKSFPCGHCSMGFYMAIPYLFFRHRRRLLAWTLLITGSAYGIIIGIARMMAGGHFASDVLWAGGLVWLVALSGYYLFRADRPYVPPPDLPSAGKKNVRRASLIVGILLPVITIGLLLATPYISSKKMDVTKSEIRAAGCRVIKADLLNAIVHVSADTCFHLEYSVNAFGFPNSKIRGVWTLGDTSRYVFQRMGWFTEVRNTIKLGLPVADSIDYYLTVDKGKMIVSLPDSCSVRFLFRVNKGDLILQFNPKHYALVGNASLISNPGQTTLNIFPVRPATWQGGTIGFVLGKGSLRVEPVEP